VSIYPAWGTARNHVDALLGWRVLNEATSEAVSQFAGLLRSKGMKESSVATNLRTLQAALSWASNMQMIPAVSFSQPKRGRRGTQMRSRPITDVELGRMLRAARVVRPRDARLWRRLLIGLWLSGLRLGEVLVFGWDASHSIRAVLTGKHPQFRIYAEGEKGRKDRYLPMTPDFAKWLLKTPPDERHGLVFKLPYATVDNIGRRIGEIGEAAGVVVNEDGKRASAHDLRRAFGTRWARRVKPAVLRTLMRHDDISTTMQYYVDIDADDIAAELWDEFG
jgi:integrase